MRSDSSQKTRLICRKWKSHRNEVPKGHGGILFGPVKVMKEVVTKRICRFDFGPAVFKCSRNFKLLEFWFWSTIKLLEISILIQFELLKMDQNQNTNSLIIIFSKIMVYQNRNLFMLFQSNTGSNHLWKNGTAKIYRLKSKKPSYRYIFAVQGLSTPLRS